MCLSWGLASDNDVLEDLPLRLVPGPYPAAIVAPSVGAAKGGRDTSKPWDTTKVPPPFSWGIEDLHIFF